MQGAGEFIVNLLFVCAGIAFNAKKRRVFCVQQNEAICDLLPADGTGIRCALTATNGSLS